MIFSSIFLKYEAKLTGFMNENPPSHVLSSGDSGRAEDLGGMFRLRRSVQKGPHRRVEMQEVTAWESTPPKLNSSSLKMAGWQTTFLSGR